MATKAEVVPDVHGEIRQKLTDAGLIGKDAAGAEGDVREQVFSLSQIELLFMAADQLGLEFPRSGHVSPEQMRNGVICALLGVSIPLETL